MADKILHRDDADDPFTLAAELRSFGRRRGRKLSAEQARLFNGVLPALRPDLDQTAPADMRQLFTPAATAVWLEIGFGGGEHLIAQARANRNVGLIGCEPFEDGVIKAVAAVEADGLGNVRVHPDDARDLLDRKSVV